MVYSYSKGYKAVTRLSDFLQWNYAFVSLANTSRLLAMSSRPIPPEASEFIPEPSADCWRGMDSSRLCTHKNVNIGEFYTLATDGVVVVIKLMSGRLDIIHLANIVFPEKQRAVGTPRKSNPLSKAKRTIAKAYGLKPEQIEQLLNL